MVSVFDDFESSTETQSNPEIGQPKRVTDIFDDFEAPDVTSEEALTNLKIAQSGVENPDQYAESVKLSNKFGVSASAVNSDLSFYQREGVKSDATFNELAAKRSKFFSSLDNSIQAKDDLESLAKIDKEMDDVGFLKGLFDSAVSGSARLASGFAKSAALFHNEQSALPPGLVDFTGGNAVGGEAKPEVPKALYDNKVTQYLDRKGNEFAPKELNMSITTEVKNGNFANAGKAFAYQVASNSPQLFLMLANPAVGLAGLGLSSGGSKLSENLEQGIDPDRAASSAILNAGIETGIESLGGIGSPGFKQVLKGVVEEFGEKTAKEVFKQGFKQVVKAGAEEGAEEAVTTLAQAAVDYALDIDRNAFDGILTKSADAFIVGAGSGMSTTSIALTAESSMKMARQNVHLVQQLGAYQKIGDILKESKLYKRNPEVAQQYLEDTFKGTGAEKVYINIDDFESYFQSENKSGAEAASELNITEAYNKASETGGDIEVSTAAWAAVAANTDYYQGLSKDIRFSPEQESLRQIEQSRAEASAQTKRAADESRLEPIEKIDSSRLATDSDVKTIFKSQSRAQEWLMLNEARVQDENAMGVEERAFTQSKIDLVKKALPQLSSGETSADLAKRRTRQTKEVVDFVYDSLIKAGISRDEARVNAQVYGERYWARSERSGLAKTPLQFAQSQFQGFNPMDSSELGPGVIDDRVNAVDIADLIAMQAGPEFDLDGTRIYQEDVVSALRASIERGEAGEILTKSDENGDVIGALRKESSFPEFFKNKGYTKKETLKIIDKHLAGETLTEKQQAIFDDLYSGAFEATSRREFFQDHSATYGTFVVREDMPKEISILKIAESTLSKDEYKSLKNAKVWASDNLRNQSVRNEMTGMDIDLPQGGFNKVGVGRSSIQNIAALVNIDKLIKTAVYDGAESVSKDKPDIFRYHRFYAPLDINGTSYIVRIKVSEGRDGNKFYHEIGVENKTLRSRSKPINPSLLTDQAVTEGDSIDGNLSGQDTMLGSPQSNVDRSVVSINDFAAEINEARKEYSWLQSEQGAAGPRGRIRFGRDRMAIIDLFQHKDRSTVMHESAHLWLEETIEDAYADYANDNIRSDLDTLLKWFNLDVRTSDGESAVRTAIQVSHHEQFAEGFEAYIMEGKAPNRKLAKAFAAFRVWLTSIYGAIKNLRVPLNQDVREVMDRMLAVEAVAKQSEMLMGYSPMLGTEHLAMMNDNERIDYVLTLEEAKDEVRKNLTKAYLEDETKKDQRLYKETRARIVDEETLRLNEDRALQTEAALRTGKMPDGSALSEELQGIKIDRASLIALMGSNIDPRIEKMTHRKNGLPIEAVAEIFGWSDPRDMINSIQRTPSFQNSLEQAVERRMNEVYPDRFEPETAIEDAAQFYHNHAQEKLHQLEMKFIRDNAPKLSKRLLEILGKTQSRNEYYKQAAEKSVQQSRASEVTAYRFQQTERKKNLEAHKAMARNQFDEAMKAKHESLLNFEMFKQARAFEDRKSRDEALFTQIFGSDKKIGANRDLHVVMAARSLVNFLNGDTEADVMAPLKKLADLDPDAYENMTNLANGLLETFRKGEDFTVQDYYLLSDSVKAMWDYSREIRQLSLGDSKVEVQQAVAEMATELRAQSENGARAGMEKALGTKDKTILWFRSQLAAITRLEHWALGVGPSLHKYIYKPMIDAETKYKLRKNEELAKLNELVAKLGPQSKESILSESLNYEFKDITEVLGAMIHMGNKSNLERLLLGRNWGVKLADGTLDTSRWDSFLLKLYNEGTLKKEHYDFVQSIWDYMESHKNEAWKTHYKLQGYYPKEIKVEPIQTPFGEYRGGYAPAVYDSNLRNSVDKARSAELMGNANILNPSVGSGFTKERADNFYDVIKIDLNGIIQATDKTLKFTYLQPAISTVNRILNSNQFNDALNEYDRRVTSDLIRPAIARFSRQSAVLATATESESSNAKALGLLRSRTSALFMALNIPNIFQNPTSISAAASEVNPKYLALGAKNYLLSPRNFSEAVTLKSDYMKARALDSQEKTLEDFDRILNAKNDSHQMALNLRERALDIAMAGERLTNTASAAIVWTAAYGQHLDQGNLEAEAIAYADKVVRITQGDMSPLSISHREGGSAFLRIFNMFSSFFNNSLNKLMLDNKVASQEQDRIKAVSIRLRSFVSIVSIPAIAGALIYRAFSGMGLDEDEDGEYLDDLMDIMIISQLRFLLAGVPVVGTVGQYAIDKVLGKGGRSEALSSPVSSAVNIAFDSYKIYENLMDDKDFTSRESRSIAYALGLMTGLPTTIVSKPAGYLLDVEAGRANPSGPLDYTRGLLTGKKGAK